MTKANREVLRTYRKLQHEFDQSVSYPDWVGRRLRVLSETTSNVSCAIFKRLVKSICE